MVFFFFSLGFISFNNYYYQKEQQASSNTIITINILPRSLYCHSKWEYLFNDLNAFYMKQNVCNVYLLVITYYYYDLYQNMYRDNLYEISLNALTIILLYNKIWLSLF